MDTLIRRVRGAAGLGLVWGSAWAALFAGLSIGIGAVWPDQIDAGEGPLRVGAIGAGIGLVSGAAFGAILALVEKRHAIGELALIRVAAWGILASALFPLATARSDQALVFAPFGAALALSTVWLARRARARRGDALSGFLFACVRDALGTVAQESST